MEATAMATKNAASVGAIDLQRFEIETPVGNVIGAVRDGRLCALGFTEQWPRLDTRLVRRFGTITWREAPRAPAAVALAAYFAGRLDAIDDLHVDMAATPFHLDVWEALRRIPVGTTWSYRELAHAVGRPAAVRAVGLANGANPVAIVVPCHRVIGADGTLTGYGGGLSRKAWLLSHEGAQLPLRVRVG